jgi:hypothetical protein
MSSLRELTNAELDIVGGGAIAIARPEPISRVNPIIVILEDILQILEGGERKAPAPAQKF